MNDVLPVFLDGDVSRVPSQFMYRDTSSEVGHQSAAVSSSSIEPSVPGPSTYQVMRGYDTRAAGRCVQPSMPCCKPFSLWRASTHRVLPVWFGQAISIWSRGATQLPKANFTIATAKTSTNFPFRGEKIECFDFLHKDFVEVLPSSCGSLLR